MLTTARQMIPQTFFDPYLESSPEEDDPGSGAPEGLVDGGGDHVAVREGGGNHSRRHQTTATRPEPSDRQNHFRFLFQRENTLGIDLILTFSLCILSCEIKERTDFKFFTYWNKL